MWRGGVGHLLRKSNSIILIQFFLDCNWKIHNGECNLVATFCFFAIKTIFYLRVGKVWFLLGVKSPVELRGTIWALYYYIFDANEKHGEKRGWQYIYIYILYGHAQPFRVVLPYCLVYYPPKSLYNNIPIYCKGY